MILPQIENRSILTLSRVLSGKESSSIKYDNLFNSLNRGAFKRNVVFIVDGLGESYLERFNGSFIGSRNRSIIDSIFPTTTTTAIISMLTGKSVCDHGISGWYMRDDHISSEPISILKNEERFSNNQLQFNYSLGVSQFEKSTFIVPKEFENSLIISDILHNCNNYYYSRYNDIPDFIKKLDKRGSIFIYLPELDFTLHKYGLLSYEGKKCFELIDKLIECCSEQLSAKDRVIVTADHGHIDRGEYIDLRKIEEVYSLLSYPMCGESRASYLYVKDKELFRDRFNNCKISSNSVIIDTQNGIDDGWFGNGKINSSFHRRIGDFILLPKDGFTIFDDSVEICKSVHGGLSCEEIKVPLVIID